MRPALATVLALVCASVSSLTAQEGGSVPGPHARLAVPSAIVHRASGRIVADGSLDDEGWASATILTDFHETYPGDNTPPPVRIRVRLAYDSSALYIAFEVDDDPAEIRASWRQRDQIWSDDYVGFLLDTYGDGNWASMLFANPFGVQGDSRYSNTAGEDDGFDVVFESGGRITDHGYQVEMAIPFRSLRFPDRPVQDWRATFWVTHPRASRANYSWAPVQRDDPCTICQFGHLLGIEGVTPGDHIQLLPSVTASQESHRPSADPDAALAHGGIRGDVSLGMRYDPGSSTTIEASVNPDFSQVESDAAQIDVNSAFALFYPEHRPFFQEGADLYTTHMSAVYTRSINDPLAVAKFTSSWGRTSLIAISGWDEHSPIVLPFEEHSAVVPDGGRSISTIFRLRQSFGSSSWIGAIATDRHFSSDGSGSLAGVDGTIRLNENYSVKLLALASHTRERSDSALAPQLAGERFDGGRHTAVLDGEQYSGYAWYAGIEQSSRTWAASLVSTGWSPTFRADNGFITQNDRNHLHLDTKAVFYPGGFFDEIDPGFFAARVWNLAGIRKDEWITPSLSVAMKGQTRVTVSWLSSDELFRGVQFDGIRRGTIEASSSFSDPVQVELSVARGRFIARMLDVPVLGRGTQVEAAATIKPMARLVIEPAFQFSELSTPEGAEIYRGSISRLRLWYQFTRELSLRAVVQYHSFDKRLSFEPLLTWRLNPFTIFYVGATYHYDEPADPLETSPERLWSVGERRFFLKFQYLVLD